jgi:opacity protein-like surface antigen
MNTHKSSGDITMLKKTMLLLGVTILFAGQLHAQSMSIGPQVGYYKTANADNGSYLAGVAWRLNLIPLFGIEATINYRQEQYDNGALIVRSWPVTVTGMVYIIPIVYGAVGFGWYNLMYDYDQAKLPLVQDQTIQKVGWHFGGGVELPVSSSFKLTGDLRYVFLNYNFDGLPGSSTVQSNFTVITVGILFNL